MRPRRKSRARMMPIAVPAVLEDAPTVPPCSLSPVSPEVLVEVGAGMVPPVAYVAVPPELTAPALEAPGTTAAFATPVTPPLLPEDPLDPELDDPPLLPPSLSP